MFKKKKSKECDKQPIVVNFKEILSPSDTKNQRFCHFWGYYEVYEDIISDLRYKNFLYSVCLLPKIL